MLEFYKWAVANFIDFCGITAVFAFALAYVGEAWRGK